MRTSSDNLTAAEETLLSSLSSLSDTASNEKIAKVGDTLVHQTFIPSGDSVLASSAATVANQLILSAGASRNVTYNSTITGLIKLAAGVVSQATAGTDYVTGASTNTFTNKTFNANGTGNSITNLETADFATNVVDIDVSLTANSDTRIASQKAVKAYVDANVSGLKWKDPVTLATTGNITLSGEQTIDGTLTSTTRILVKSQTSKPENGIYITDAAGWTRSSDMNAGAEFPGAACFVLSGTANGGTGWTCTNTTAVNIGVDDVNFSQFTGATIYTAGTGLQLALNQFSIDSTVATLTGSQILTNKTINASNNTISNLLHGTQVDNPTSGVHGVVGTVVGTSDTQVLTNKTYDASANTLSNINTTHFAAGVIDTDLTTVSASDDTIPSAKATKTYVDSKAFAWGASISGGSSTGATVNINNSSATSTTAFSSTIGNTQTNNGIICYKANLGTADVTSTAFYGVGLLTKHKIFEAAFSSTATGGSAFYTSSNTNDYNGTLTSFNIASANIKTNRILPTCYVSQSRVLLDATLTDNYNLYEMVRSQEAAYGAVGSYAVTGSVLQLSNASTNTAFTITDTVTLLKLINTNSTGAHIKFTKNTSGTATNEGDMVYDGTHLYFKPASTQIDLLASGSGDVVGPGSSTDNAIVRFDTTTGKLLHNSVVTITDAGSIYIPDGQKVYDATGVASLTLASSGLVLTAGSKPVLITDGDNVSFYSNILAFLTSTTTTITFGPGSTNQMDITSAGVRLGATGARVTAIIDDDTMATATATNLCTGESIKAYVDAQVVGTGDFTGPASSTDEAIVRFNGVTGKVGQTSLVTISDLGTVNIPTGQTYSINGTALAKGDVGLGNVTNESKATMFTSPTFTGTPIAPTAGADTNTTQVATTAFVVGQVGTANPLMNGSVSVGVSLKYSRQDHVHASDTTKAAVGANSDITSLSGLTTALSIAQGGTGQTSAQNAINALTQVSAASVNQVLTKDISGNAVFASVVGTGDVVGASSSTDNEIVRFDSVTGKLIQSSVSPATIDDSGSINIPSGQTYKINGTSLAKGDVGLGNVTNESKATMFTSPTFTSIPVAPTAAVDTNTTQLATTAFVLAQAGDTNPVMNGVVAIGTSTKFARQDHVHASDTSRAASGANTDITSILNASFKLGRDADNYIDFGTDNTIIHRVNAASQYNDVDGAIVPEVTNDIDLGSTTKGFKVLYMSDGTDEWAISIDTNGNLTTVKQA